jgi:hypothetical protein
MLTLAKRRQGRRQRRGRQTCVIFQGNLAQRLPQPIENDPPQYRAYPRQQFRFAARRGTALPDLDVGFLHQVTRDIPVTDRAHAVPIENGEIAAIQQSQRTIYPLTPIAASLHENRLIRKEHPGMSNAAGVNQPYPSGYG